MDISADQWSQMPTDKCTQMFACRWNLMSAGWRSSEGCPQSIADIWIQMSFDGYRQLLAESILIIN